MRQIFPLGDYVRRTGDTMTGPLTIERDVTTYTDGFIVLQRKSANGYHLPIVFRSYDGTNLAVIRAESWGHLNLSPKGWGIIRSPWTDLGSPAHWQLYQFPSALTPRRVMMVETLLFG